MNAKLSFALAIAAALLAATAAASGQTPVGTAFTYQGSLSLSGSPVTGTADFEFSLWERSSGPPQIGSTVPVGSVNVVDGLFTVVIDFGEDPWTENEVRWLEIAVDYPQGTGFVTLTPRQELTPTAFSLATRGLNVDVAGNVGIGTSTPTEKLEVDGGAWISGALRVGNTLYFEQYPSGAACLDCITASSGTINFDDEDLYTTGNVSIGLATPSFTYPLHVETSSSNIPAVYAKTTYTGAAYSSALYGSCGSGAAKVVQGISTASSGETYGGHFKAGSTDGTGVYAEAPEYGVRAKSTALNSVAYGGHFTTASRIGRAVYGQAIAIMGSNYGGYFESKSPNGVGAFGDAQKYGVWGRSESGRGVYGQASGTTGENYGVYGSSASTFGRGVFGEATATTGTTFGGRFESDSTSGRGAYGRATANSGTNYGVYGLTESPDGYGVYGKGPECGVRGVATDASGTTYGVYGEANAQYGRGVNGTTSGSGGRGVAGWAYHTTGVNYGVFGWTSSPNGYGVYCAGNFRATGTKQFVQPHPYDPSKEISFVCLEGNESGTYFRGSSELADGVAVIEVPEEFRLVSEADGLTVQVTPMGPGADLWVESKNLDQIVVRGARDVEFDYFVNGIRRGYRDLQLVGENHAFVPETRGVPFGTQYPDALRLILVENGILNPDFTPNEQTAQRLGWLLSDPVDDEAPQPE